MNPERIPPDWPDLEDQLARRAGPEPAADLRGRVLSAMANARTLPVAAPPASRWRFIWRAAAAVVLALNLAMSAANGIRFQRLPEPAVQADAGRPPTVNADDRFQRLAAGALASLKPAPDVGELSRNLFDRRSQSDPAP